MQPQPTPPNTPENQTPETQQQSENSDQKHQHNIQCCADKKPKFIIIILLLGIGVFFLFNAKDTTKEPELPPVDQIDLYTAPPTNQGIQGTLVYFDKDDPETPVPLNNYPIFITSKRDPNYVAQVLTELCGTFKLDLHRGDYTVCVRENISCQDTTIFYQEYSIVDITYQP